MKQLPLSVNTCVMRKGKGGGRFAQESDGAGFGFVVLDGEVDRARAAVDGDVEIALAPFAIGGLQLGQMLDVDMHEAEVVVLEGALAFGRLCRCRLGAASVQALGLEDAPDAVAIEMRQEVTNYINQKVSPARRRTIHVQRVAALRDLISAV